MIISEQLLTALGACVEGTDWWNSNYVGGTATNTLLKLREAKETEFYLWAKQNFSTDIAMLSTAHEFVGNYSVFSPDGSFEYPSYSDAKENVHVKIDEYISKYNYMFSINAIVFDGNGNSIVVPCLHEAEIANAVGYDAFDHEIGRYIQFPTFSSAKAFSDTKYNAYKELVSKQFTIKLLARDLEKEYEVWIECFDENGVIKARSADGSIVEIIEQIG